ncbi:putative transmembrane protein [Trifolium medium]|uniref:Putative transmembrane protein n=1 Tax=Trifolium medium TaxID=97028 RepID=A0A392NGG3_9FABA|nr:putative transmembrane protein [Trifolium medium]
MGRLPRCFVREFGEAISEYVVLRDPNHNEFEVQVVKQSCDMYFSEGWVSLKDVYDVCFGAWVAITYVSPSLLTIRLLSRWGAEVRYPCYDPPLRHLLARSGPNCLLQDFVSMLCSPGSSRPKSLVQSYVKEITPYDVQSGTLVLPFHSFGQSAFAFVFSDLILVDNVGIQYKCDLKFGVDAVGEMACDSII